MRFQYSPVPSWEAVEAQPTTEASATAKKNAMKRLMVNVMIVLLVVMLDRLTQFKFLHPVRHLHSLETCLRPAAAAGKLSIPYSLFLHSPAGTQSGLCLLLFISSSVRLSRFGIVENNIHAAIFLLAFQAGVVGEAARLAEAFSAQP